MIEAKHMWQGYVILLEMLHTQNSIQLTTDMSSLETGYMFKVHSVSQCTLTYMYWVLKQYKTTVLYEHVYFVCTFVNYDVNKL